MGRAEVKFIEQHIELEACALHRLTNLARDLHDIALVVVLDIWEHYYDETNLRTYITRRIDDHGRMSDE